MLNPRFSLGISDNTYFCYFYWSEMESKAKCTNGQSWTTRCQVWSISGTKAWEISVKKQLTMEITVKFILGETGNQISRKPRTRFGVNFNNFWQTILKVFLVAMLVLSLTFSAKVQALVRNTIKILLILCVVDYLCIMLQTPPPHYTGTHMIKDSPRVGTISY